MRKSGWAALAALLFTGCATIEHAQENQPPDAEALAAEFEAFCASDPPMPCRENVEFTLVLDEAGNRETFRFDRMPPPLQQDIITLLPGETLYVTGRFEDGVLGHRRGSYEPFDEPHLKFAFSQSDGEPNMLLIVTSTFDVPLKYRLVMMPPDSGDLYKTSTCPVIANGGAYEMWPHAIFQLMVLEVRAMEDSDRMVCEW